MSIKLSLLYSLLHDNELFEIKNNKFIKEIETKISEDITISDIKDYDCDLKLIFISSGGSEGLFLNNYKYLKPPIYILTSGENNSLAASLEILTYLNNENVKSEIIHGDIDYVAQRIKTLEQIEYVKRKMKDLNFGVIGKPSDWLIASIPNYLNVKEKFGINLIDIDIDELINNYNRSDLYNNLSDKLYNTNYDKKFDRIEINKAENVNKALMKIVDKYKLNGLTIRCFDLLSKINTTGCLGIAKLNDLGICSSCEGDIMGLITMMIASLITKKATFLANPSRIDPIKNEIVFAHCTVPFSMLDDYEFCTHFESKIGLAIRGKMKEEDVTIFRIASDLKRYFVSEGKIINNLREDGLCRTQIKIKFEENVSELLTKPCGNHHVIFYGHYAKVIKYLMDGIL